jgi:hypothetical protein
MRKARAWAARLAVCWAAVVGALGGHRTRKLEANTVLSVTNVRTTETIATVEGYAAKNDISFGAGAAASSAAARWGGRRRL